MHTSKKMWWKYKYTIDWQFQFQLYVIVALQSTTTMDGGPVTPTAATVRTALHYFAGTTDSWCLSKGFIKDWKSAKLFSSATFSVSNFSSGDSPLPAVSSAAEGEFFFFEIFSTFQECFIKSAAFRLSSYVAILQNKPPQVLRLLWKSNKQTFAKVSLEQFFSLQSVPDERRSWLLGPDCCLSDVQRMSQSAETKKRTKQPSPFLTLSNRLPSRLSVAHKLPCPPTANAPARVGR